MTELKACPFCGSNEITIIKDTVDIGGFSYVECLECHCTSSWIKGENYNKWNTRQPVDNWKPIEKLTEEILTTKEKIPFIMMYQATEPDFYHKYGSIGMFILAKNDNDEFLICSNSSNWTVPLSKISETVFTHYKIITPPQTNQS